MIVKLNELHNRLKDKILDILVPSIVEMGPSVEDRLVLIESIMTASVLVITNKRDPALKILDILTEGVAKRIKAVADV